MKKLATFLLALLCALSLVAFTACGETTDGSTDDTTNSGSQNDGSQGNGSQNGGSQGGGSSQDSEKTITGVTFTDETHTYTGSEFELTVKGELPDGVSVSYTGNRGTNAGTYQAQAVLSGTGYKTLTLSAKLTITKATITGVTLEDAKFTSNGQPRSLEVTGTVPEGVTVTYSGNGKTAIGSYTVTATLSGANYETLVLTATMEITPSLSEMAKYILDRFGNTPDVWSFLPDSFRLDEDRAYTGSTSIDLTVDTPIASIPKTGIGKQLDVVYGTVIEMQELLGYANTFYGSLNAIGSLYQTFINSNPDNYRIFQSQTSGGAVQFRIELTDTTYNLYAKIGPASLELFSVIEGEGYSGRIQLSDTNALKFVVGENSLKIGLSIFNVAVTQLEFVRAGSTVTGYLYESLGAEIAGQRREFTTSALLTWSGDYVSVAGTNGDFFLGSKGSVVELYSASTGAYLGSEVREEGLTASYDTYWLHLSTLSNLTSVRAVKKTGVGALTALNPHSIYVNGANSVFETKKVLTSRRYDIELKTFYFYTYDEAEEKFEKISMELPMLFVQEAYIDTLTADIRDENSALSSVTFNKPAFVSMLNTAYKTQLALYETIKELISTDDVVAFIGSGTKNNYFD